MPHVHQLPINTLVIATLVVGTVLSCVMVAYGFSRFRFPGRNVLFLIMLSTMMIPYAITLIPQYIFFSQIGWVNTFLPLAVPAFFASPYFIFLLRQFFMSIPYDLDEAARIDGAGIAAHPVAGAAARDAPSDNRHGRADLHRRLEGFPGPGRLPAGRQPNTPSRWAWPSSTTPCPASRAGIC